MAFPDTTYTDYNSAASGMFAKAAAAGLDLSGLNPIAQIQSAVANLLVSDPSTVTIPAGDVLSGTFGANKSGGADTGTYTFPGALVLTGALSGVTTLGASSTVTVTQATANTAIQVSTGYSLTGSSAVTMVSYAGTWNTSGTPTALKVAITNTAANAASLLMNLLAGAGGVTSMFSVRADGLITGAAGLTIAGAMGGATSVTFSTNAISTTALATPSALAATQFTAFASTVSGAAIMGFGTTNDVALMNRAGTVVLGVGPNTTTVNLIGGLTMTTSGSEVILANAALATNATAGFTYLPSCAGTPSGAPGSAGAGKIAAVYDTTGHKIWFYDQPATAWKSVAVT